MRELPWVAAEAKKLLDMIYAPMYTKTLFAGIELDVFSELQEAKTYHEIAEKLGLHPENTAHLLDALTAMELVEKNKGFYRNTALSGKYLVRGHGLYIGEHLRVTNMSTGFDGIDIVKLVKEGPNSGYEDKEGLEAYGVFGDWTEMIKRAQKGGRERGIGAIAAALPEFEGFRKMLDLGGGAGLLGMAVVKAHPVMKGVIFAALSAFMNACMAQIESLLITCSMAF